MSHSWAWIAVNLVASLCTPHRIKVACCDLRTAIARTLWAIRPAASTSAASASAASAAVAATEPAAASTAAVVKQEIYTQEHGVQADVPNNFPRIPAAAATAAILAHQRRSESVRSHSSNAVCIATHLSTQC